MKQLVARWESQRKKYWVELYYEPDSMGGKWSYRADNGGGYLGHCAGEVAMQHAAQQAAYAPSGMKRTHYEEPCL